MVSCLLAWENASDREGKLFLLPSDLLLGHLVVIWLVEEEVRSQLLVLVACEVSLNNCVAWKAQSAQPLDSITFFFGDADRDCSWWHRTLVTHTTNGVATTNILRGLSVRNLMYRICNHIPHSAAARIDLGSVQSSALAVGCLQRPAAGLAQAWLAVVGQAV